MCFEINTKTNIITQKYQQYISDFKAENEAAGTSDKNQ